MPSGPTTRVFSAGWIWLFLPVYLLHLLDERFFAMGTAEWATLHMGVYLTNEAWLVINVAWLAGLTLVVTLMARGAWPDWVAIVLATHLAIHSLTRVVGSIVFPGWCPGVVSGVGVGLPWATVTFVRGLRALPPRQLISGVVLGVLSLQPVWDFLMLPVLSPRPPAA